MKTPCSDYVSTKGLMFFPRMLDKLRLRDQGLLPADYNYAGGPMHDCFDGYCCRFFAIDPLALVESRSRLWTPTRRRILEWCFEKFGRADEEKIKFWNNFVTTRGWRDDSSRELQQEKKAHGLGDRAADTPDLGRLITDADEGRTISRTTESFAQ